MTEWITCLDGFIVADVIRWTEAVWTGSHETKIGERSIEAEVLREDRPKGCVCLLVRRCDVDVISGATVETYTPGQEISRQRLALEHLRIERRPWQEEGARALLHAGYKHAAKNLSSPMAG